MGEVMRQATYNAACFVIGFVIGCVSLLPVMLVIRVATLWLD